MAVDSISAVAVGYVKTESAARLEMDGRCAPWALDTTGDTKEIEQQSAAENTP